MAAGIHGGAEAAAADATHASLVAGASALPTRAEGGRAVAHASVVIATYNRVASLQRMLGELAQQSLVPERYEVVVVDDGSAEPVRPRLGHERYPFRLVVVEQANAGPAAARHRGIECATGDIIVIVDDDMRLPPSFVEAHLRAHPPGSRRAVLGPYYDDETAGRLPLHQRMGTRSVLRSMRAARDGRRVAGSRLYTGNVSFRRDDYLAVGGFDPAFRISEDAELGVRLERAGVEVVFAEDAATVHASDHTDLGAWVRRSIAYGRADSLMAAKHPDDPDTSPWRFLTHVSKLSRPALLASALAPAAMRPLAWAAVHASRLADAMRLERIALAGITFAYGLLYFRGVREAAGSRGAVLAGLRRYLNVAPPQRLGFAGKYAKAWADLAADHEAIRQATEKYRGEILPASRLGVDLVQRIGFQMMGAYRMMRFFRHAGLTLLAKVTSRVIRHLYGADVHWDADFAPGVILVHGMGLVVAPGVRVGPGCVLFQHVTLGRSVHPETRETGVPTLEAHVHVMPGATLLGPIVVGERSKVMASAVLMQSVPPRSLVEVPAPVIRPRARG